MSWLLSGVMSGVRRSVSGILWYYVSGIYPYRARVCFFPFPCPASVHGVVHWRLLLSVLVFGVSRC